MRRIIKYASRIEGEPKTICAECCHSIHLRNPRLRRSWLCYGPWLKVTDPVDGKAKPFYEDCSEKNGGDCQHYSLKLGLLSRMWTAFVKTFSLVNP
jgi:hypothetical protein